MMGRLTPMFALCLLALRALAADAPDIPPPGAPAPPVGVPDLRTACASDIQKLCAGVQPGGGRILACIKDHREELSNGCKEAVRRLRSVPS